MHLSVTCSRCESKYQLDPGMRGKRMRCPNPICRAVIEVRDDNDKPAEAAPVVEPAKPKEAAAPVVEVKKPEPVKRKPVPKPLEPVPDFGDDFPGDDEAAPAASAPALATEAWQPEAYVPPPARDEVVPQPAKITLPPAPRKRRLALYGISAMLLILGIVGAAGWWRVSSRIESNEAERFQKAEELYRKDEFADASAAFQKLHRDFADSPHNKKYRFLAELSDVRQAAYAPRETPDEAVQALDRVLQLAVVHKGTPLLKERETDLWQTLQHLANQLTKLAEQESAPALVPRARLAWAEAKKYPPPSGASPAERDRKLNDEWTRIEQVLAVHQERRHVVATIKKQIEKATAAGVQDAWALVEKTNRRDDGEIRALLDELVKAHRDQIKFVPADAQEKLPILDDDALPSLSVTPSLKAERAIAGSKSLVLALARGVLYALEPAKGEVRWVKRVGIDTQRLPLRVPADALTPELALVVSSDQHSLSAVVMETGETLWQTPLSDACVAAPVLVDRQVLLATLGGRIDEIEITQGRRLGSYHVGQPLTLGGVHQVGKSFVYFPADEFCLYVIDITKRACTNILYTRHAAGSLPGLPAVIHSDKGDWLLWSQALGLGRVEIKPYALPIEHPEQKPGVPVLRMAGLSAPPWQDAERLVVAMKTGMLSLWGFRQKGTRDPLLFPLLKHDFATDTGKQPGPCEVVHADADNIWTLTRGRLQRVETTFQQTSGPGLLARWTQPLPLGTLLHAAQVRREPNGRTILYLTTQADDEPTCVVSAIDVDEGKIVWQRQLGVTPQQAPQVVGGQVVLRDVHGLLRFQPGKTPAERWQAAGTWLLRSPTGTEHLWLTRENTYVQLSWPRGETKLHVQVGQIPGDEKTRAFDVTLPAALQGTPALGDGFVLLPLANGIVLRLNLTDGAIGNGPEDWRALGAEEATRGHLVLVSITDFLMTDGSRGLARLSIVDAKTWEKRAATQLSHRITAPPVLLPAGDSGAARVCVADASDTLTLLDAERLSVLKRWTMPGKITAGPFVRAGQIGCVVGTNRLVWLDPSKDAPIWEYAFVAAVVGAPHVIDGMLVVADVAGQILAFDPASGQKLGEGMTFKANVAATAAPLPFGPGQAFVPLTDGTVVLVPLAKLR